MSLIYQAHRLYVPNNVGLMNQTPIAALHSLEIVAVHHT